MNEIHKPLKDMSCRDFLLGCETKLDNILLEIEELREDMRENYNKLYKQFKILAVSIGICLGLTLHQMITLAFF